MTKEGSGLRKVSPYGLSTVGDTIARFCRVARPGVSATKPLRRDWKGGLAGGREGGEGGSADDPPPRRPAQRCQDELVKVQQLVDGKTIRLFGDILEPGARIEPHATTP